jgi:hypothetical protein
MKKWLLGFLSIGAAFICAGCGSMKMDTSIRYNSDQSGQFQMAIALDGALAGLATREEGNFDRWDKVSGARIREYDDDDKHYYEVTLPFKNPAQLEKALSEAGYTIKFKKRSTPFYHRYEASFAYPEDFVEEIEASSKVDEDTEDFFSQKELENLFNSMLSFKVNISLPGTIVETNAPVVKEHVASWTQRPRQLSTPKLLQASSRELNWAGVITMTVLVLLIILEIIRKVNTGSHEN